jgi:hypothetical protein
MNMSFTEKARDASTGSVRMKGVSYTLLVLAGPLLMAILLYLLAPTTIFQTPPM